MNVRIGIVGLGLIGGSLAKAFKKNLSNTTIIACDKNKETLISARKSGVIDIITNNIDCNFKNCDYIFLCMPIELNIKFLKVLKSIVNSNCVITDVGSTKSNIHNAVIKENLENQFIGGHPMAGSEKSGYEFSNANLFVNSYYVITPTDKTNEIKLHEFENLIISINAKPIIIDDYQKHDYAVAGISHIPHIIAAELVNLVNSTDEDNNLMKILASTGFKDTTRIADCSSEVWEQICMTNVDNIVDLLDIYITQLVTIKENIKNKNNKYIVERFSNSSECRRQMFL